MKHATLLLGLAIVLASIAAVQAEMLNCDGRIVEPKFTDKGLLEGVTISDFSRPWRGDVRIDFVWKDTKNYGTATLNGKRCKVPE